MATPLVHIWRTREIVTADTMNRFVRDAHAFLLRTPACRVSARQRGTHPNSAPGDAYGRGWLAFNTWTSLPWFAPGKGTRPADEYDPSGMARPGDGGILWRLTAPEDGLYAVSFGGVIETNGEAANVHFRLGKNVLADDQWNSSAVFAAHCPGRALTAGDGTSRYIGSMSTTINLKRGDTVSAAGIADKDFVLGRSDLAGRSFLELRWVGRHP